MGGHENVEAQEQQMPSGPGATKRSVKQAGYMHAVVHPLWHPVKFSLQTRVGPYMPFELPIHTGQVTVLNVVTAHDVGTVINPLAHQGQIDGGVVTGLGLAVTEELVSESGQILNGHLGAYKLPTIAYPSPGDRPRADQRRRRSTVTR